MRCLRLHRRGSSRPYRLPPLAALAHALLLLYFALLSPATRGVHAVETHFQHRFVYERADGWIFTNTSGSSTTAMQGVAFGGTGSGQLARWNTRTVVAQFGMESGSRVDIEVRELAYPPLMSPAPDGVRAAARQHVPLVFTLYDNDQWRVYSVLQLRDVPLRNPAILCHYPSSMRFAVSGGGTGGSSSSSHGNRDRQHAPHKVSFVVQKASLYTLQMQVCGDASVDVKGTARMVNLGFDGRLSEHLGVEKLGLLPLYKVVVVIYTLFAMLWALECFLRRRNVPRIGYAFQAALHVKTIDATLKLWLYRELSVTGSRNTLLDALQTASESAASAVLLAVLLFAALGWSLTRNTLSRRELQLIAVIFSVYAVIALVKARCSAADEQQQLQRLGEPSDVCKVYLLTEYVIRSAVMLGVVVALNFTIAQLRLALTEARWHHCVTPLTYMKLQQFQRFRAVFLLYLLLPTCLLIMSLLVITPPGSWRFDWVNALLSECAALFIYATVGLILRPLDAYIYARISKGTNLRTSADTGTNATSGANATSRDSDDADPRNGVGDTSGMDDTDAALAAAAVSAMPRREMPSGAAVVPVDEDVLESNRRLLVQYPVRRRSVSPQRHSESPSSSSAHSSMASSPTSALANVSLLRAAATTGVSETGTATAGANVDVL